MKVGYSKSFEKSVRRLSGKKLESVKRVIREVMSASSVDDITDCLKLAAYDDVYRIRIGDMRAFFVLHIVKMEVEGKTSEEVIFEYLVSRGEAYSKNIATQLRRLDRQ